MENTVERRKKAAFQEPAPNAVIKGNVYDAQTGQTLWIRIDRMNLNIFESYIDKKILARGYDYYENDCPYDMGEYCKHQVAVFLALRDMKNNIPGGNSHIPKAPDIEKILSDRTKDELVEFLLDIASEYEEIKQRIELNFDIYEVVPQARKVI